MLPARLRADDHVPGCSACWAARAGGKQAGADPRGASPRRARRSGIVLYTWRDRRVRLAARGWGQGMHVGRDGRVRQVARRGRRVDVGCDGRVRCRWHGCPARSCTWTTRRVSARWTPRSQATGWRSSEASAASKNSSRRCALKVARSASSRRPVESRCDKRMAHPASWRWGSGNLQTKIPQFFK